MNTAQRKLADALYEADFDLDEVAAIMSAIELAIVVGDKAETFPYGHPNNPSNQHAKKVANILRKYKMEPT